MTTPNSTTESDNLRDAIQQARDALSMAAFRHPSASDDVGVRCSTAEKRLDAILAQSRQPQPPMRHISGVNVDVLRRAALATPPATSGMKELPEKCGSCETRCSGCPMSRPRATPPNAPQDSLVGDAERMDWLSTEAGTIRRDAMGGLVPSYINWGQGVTLRQAVDAAIRAGRKG